MVMMARNIGDTVNWYQRHAAEWACSWLRLAYFRVHRAREHHTHLAGFARKGVITCACSAGLASNGTRAYMRTLLTGSIAAPKVMMAVVMIGRRLVLGRLGSIAGIAGVLHLTILSLGSQGAGLGCRNCRAQPASRMRGKNLWLACRTHNAQA